MGVNDWNWRHPVELQDVPWDCAAASLAWALQAYGVELSEEDVVKGLGPARISPTYGLLDASGAGLVEYLAELGISAGNNPAATWREVSDAAGYQPMVIGGRQWCHWSGVRMGSAAASHAVLGVLALANPSPGWWGVGQLLKEAQFDDLGPFSAVWFPV